MPPQTDNLLEPARPVILAVGGLDPSGLAGILRDQLTIEECGGRAVCAAAALTAQGPGGVRGIFPVPPPVLDEQLRSVFKDFSVAAVKVGLIPSPELIQVLAVLLPDVPVVVNPVVWASDGTLLLEGNEERWKSEIVALGTVLCPNLPELAYLSGTSVSDLGSAETAAHLLLGGQAACRALVVKGGHGSDPTEVCDLLVGPGPTEAIRLSRSPGPGLRGTGCRHASALATALARGLALPEAARFAQSYVGWSIARPI